MVPIDESIPLIWDDGTSEPIGDAIRRTAQFRAGASPTAPKGHNEFLYTYESYAYDDIQRLFEDFNKQRNSLPNFNSRWYTEINYPHKSNFFGTLVLCNIGKEYAHMLEGKLNHTDKTTFYRPYSNYFTYHNPRNLGELADIYKDRILTLHSEYNLDINREDVEFALRVALNKGYESNQGIFGFDEKAAEWIRNLSKKLNAIKFTSDDYNYKNVKTTKDNKKKDQLKAAVDAFVDIHQKMLDFLVPDAIESFLKENLNDTLLAAAKELLPPKARLLLEGLIDKAQQIHTAISTSFDQIKDLTKDTAQLIGALLMGFANGFISLLQLILDIVAWCIDTILGLFLGLDNDKLLDVNTYIEARKRMEAMEEMYDFVAENMQHTIEGIKRLSATFKSADFYRIIDNLKSKFADTISGITKYDIAYFTGSIIFEVVVGVGLALATGGASLIAQAGSYSAKLAQLMRIVIQETVSTITLGILDLIKLLKTVWVKFLQAANKGFHAFADYIIALFTGNAFDVEVKFTPQDVADLQKEKELLFFDKDYDFESNIDDYLNKKKESLLAKNKKRSAKEIYEQRRQAIKEKALKNINRADISLKLRKHIELRTQYIQKYATKAGERELMHLFRKNMFHPVSIKNIQKFYDSMTATYPILKTKKVSFAIFETRIYKNGKPVDTKIDLAHSGPNRLHDDFLDTVSDAKYEKLQLQDSKRPRTNDTESKYVYHFISNYLMHGDYFIIKTKNTYMACGSCQREFLILKEQFGDKIRIEVEGVEIFKDSKSFEEFIKK